MFELILTICFLLGLIFVLSYGGIFLGLGAFKPREPLTTQQRRNMWLLVAIASVPGFFVLPLFMVVGAPIACFCSFRFIAKYTLARSTGAGLVAAFLPLIGALFGSLYATLAAGILVLYPLISAVVVGPIVLLAVVRFTMKKVQARRYAAFAEA